MRQCFAVCNPEFRRASNRLHLFGRIVKKLTKPQGSNRPESRVPKSDGDRRGLFRSRRERFSLLLLWLSLKVVLRFFLKGLEWN